MKNRSRHCDPRRDTDMTVNHSLLTTERKAAQQPNSTAGTVSMTYCSLERMTLIFFFFFFFLCGLRSYQVLSSTTRWVKMRTGSQSLSKLPYFFPLLFFLHAFADMLQPLLQHVKAWPRRRIQIPALLHDVVHHFRTAVRTVHLVSLLHSRHKVFQWLKKRKRDPNQVSPSSTPLCTTQLLRLSLFIMIKNTRRKRYILF